MKQLSKPTPALSLSMDALGVYISPATCKMHKLTLTLSMGDQRTAKDHGITITFQACWTSTYNYQTAGTCTNGSISPDNLVDIHATWSTCSIESLTSHIRKITLCYIERQLSHLSCYQHIASPGLRDSARSLQKDYVFSKVFICSVDSKDMYTRN